MVNPRGKRKARSPSPEPSKLANTVQNAPAKRSRTTRSTAAEFSGPKANPTTTPLLPAALLQLVSKVKRTLKRPDLPTEDVEKHLVDHGYDVGATMAAILVAEESEISELPEDSDEGGLLGVGREGSVPISELLDESDDESLISNTSRSATVTPVLATVTPGVTVASSTTITPSSINRANTLPNRSMATADQDVVTTSSSTGNAEKSRPSLLTLPRELRDQIYTELLVHDGAAHIQQLKFNFAVKSTPSFPLAIARVCKQLQEECLEVFYSENNFILDLNILSCVDWLSSLPVSVKGKITNINLSKTTMTGYIRYDLGLYDSSRLRGELVKKLVYDLDIPSISLDVPDEPTPPSGPNGGLRSFLSFNPPTDYSWSLCREFVEVLLSGGANSLRLCYPTPHASETLATALKLSAVSKFLYLDDEFEVDSNIKRHEQARIAGKRPEFKSKDDVEKWVRARRARRNFGVRYVPRKSWEQGSVVEIVRPNEGEERVVEGLGLGPSRRRRHREEYRWSMG